MGRPAIDYSGQKCGGYTVVRRSSKVHPRQHIMWDVRCDCGYRTTVPGFYLKKNEVGCVKCRHEIHVKHGYARRGRKTPEYLIFVSMHQRCENPKNKDYADYGGRGIKVCKRWSGEQGFENFLADMGERPASELELDRENNSRGYSPGNCRWVTSLENNRNRRPQRRVS